ncbi:TPA: hypothetical protein N0F65_007007 [Lagenidium giganteum]|uniref:RING-type domain-containing protein n=1 Tax=Lagenidium giganteum TaxID=4803 RepID=A0AAV2ZHE3_9STRA|nr:TPA: hypothetical protein N0F65_007007 [Lagenidium giganteum]
MRSCLSTVIDDGDDLVHVCVCYVIFLLILRSGEFTNRSQLQFYGVEAVKTEPFDACTPLQDQDLSGRIAIVQRGSCNFVMKVWNAQKANASAVVVINNEHQPQKPPRILMQRDENASHVHIPSVFVSHFDGDRSLEHMFFAPPGEPVLLTIDEHGELPDEKSSGRVLKRVFAYAFLLSVICLCSSALSLLSSGLFRWITRVTRTRASNKLPIITYEKELRRVLMQAAHASTKQASTSSPKTPLVNLLEETAATTIVTACAGSDDPTALVADATSNPVSTPCTDADVDVCSICLDDFELQERVKVLPCHHFFHVDCINPWLERRSGCCPLCKQDAIPKTKKTLLGLSIPMLDQLLQQEHIFHALFLMLPASLVSCIIVNSAASIIRNVWP